MSKKYIIVDFMNMAFRAKNAMYNSDIDTQIGMSMHITLNSIRKVYTQFSGDHLVICCEGNSWRKSHYAGYKKNRLIKMLQKTTEEQEDDAIFLQALQEFEEYLTFKTNASILKCPVAEADDMIAIFVDSHPYDEHFIISADSDFYQLLAPNVKIYNGMEDATITLDGYFKDNGEPMLDKKTGLHRTIDTPEYILFEKCIRGDSSDNIFSAYPKVRSKSTKNKVGILGAFADRENKGYDWNNFMQSTWVDENGDEQKVADRYEFNRKLIDLRLQPEDIKEQCLMSMAMSLAREPVKSHEVGINFLKFCEAWSLDKIAKYPDAYSKILNKRYVL